MASLLDLQAALPQYLLKVDLKSDNGFSRVPSETLRGKTIMLYFSAHWCPPCRSFTPQLASVYSALKSKGVDVELVFVSHDKDPEQFSHYFNHMAELGGSWLAIPFAECQAEREMLARRCSVMGIPTLTIIGPDGSIIAPNARGAVSSDTNGDNFPWVGASGGGAGGPLLVIVFMVLVFIFLPKLIGVLFR